MTKPTVIEVDCTTGISVERELTADEIKDMEKRTADFEKAEAERVAAQEAQEALKESAKAKLTSLGLTVDEAKALLG
jgi:hypothetical protein